MKKEKVKKVPKVKKISNTDLQVLRTKIKMLTVEQWNHKKGTTKYKEIGSEVAKLEAELHSHGEVLATHGTPQSQIDTVRNV